MEPSADDGKRFGEARAARNVSCGEKEMILRRIGEVQEGMGSGLRLGEARAARTVSCGRKEMILRRIGGGSGRRMGSGFSLHGGVGGFMDLLVFP